MSRSLPGPQAGLRGQGRRELRTHDAHRVLRTTAGVLGASVILSGVLALGPGSAEASAPYRVRHFDLADLRPVELPWTGEPPLRLPAAKPRDSEGVPLFRWRDGRLYYRPGTLAISGMKRLDAFIDTGDPEQLDQALKQAHRLRVMALPRRGAWWLPFWYDYPDEGQKAPWVNGMTQGLTLSFFVRLFRITGDAQHLEAAGHVFQSFQRLDRSQSTWVSFLDGDRYLWLEHYPMSRPDHVLNAHLHAVFGLYEYWQVTHSKVVRQVLEGSITTMRDHARRYRRPGGVSLYGLRHRERIHKYHEIHVWQLRLLARISGDSYFWRLANRLAQDVKPTGYVSGRPAVVRRPKTCASLVAPVGDLAAG